MKAELGIRSGAVGLNALRGKDMPAGPDGTPMGVPGPGRGHAYRDPDLVLNRAHERRVHCPGASSVAGRRHRCGGVGWCPLHRAPVVQSGRAAQCALRSAVQHPPHSPELNLRSGSFWKIRRQVEGQVHETLEAKKRAAEVGLEDMATYAEKVKHLTCWAWAPEALQYLTQNMALP